MPLPSRVADVGAHTFDCGGPSRGGEALSQLPVQRPEAEFDCRVDIGAKPGTPVANSPEKWGFHSAHRHRVAGGVDEEVADVFVLIGRDLGDRLPASDDDQEEDLPGLNLVAHEQGRNVGKFVEVVCHDRRVHLNLEAMRF